MQGHSCQLRGSKIIAMQAFSQDIGPEERARTLVSEHAFAQKVAGRDFKDEFPGPVHCNSDLIQRVQRETARRYAWLQGQSLASLWCARNQR